MGWKNHPKQKTKMKLQQTIRRHQKLQTQAQTKQLATRISYLQILMSPFPS